MIYGALIGPGGGFIGVRNPKPKLLWFKTLSPEEAREERLNLGFAIRKRAFVGILEMCCYDMVRQVHWIRYDNLCFAFFNDGAHVFLIRS